MEEIPQIDDFYVRLYPHRDDVLRPACLKAYVILDELLKGDVTFNLIGPFEAIEFLSGVLRQFDKLFSHDRPAARKGLLENILKIADDFLRKAAQLGFKEKEIESLQRIKESVNAKL